jgi:hypothetical protein
MKTRGKPCRPIGENLEESAAALKDQAEVIKLIGRSDQAATLEEMARTIEGIGKMIRGGTAEVHAVPAFPQRNY